MLRNNADARAWATFSRMPRHYHESSDLFKYPLLPSKKSIIPVTWIETWNPEYPAKLQL